jgi:hypothetical protein
MNPFVMLDWDTKEEYTTKGTGPLSLGALGVYTVVKGRREGAEDNDYVVGIHMINGTLQEQREGGIYDMLYELCSVSVPVVVVCVIDGCVVD